EMAVLHAAAAAAELGLGVEAVCASPLPGPSGNVEYFCWFRRGSAPIDSTAVAHMVATGPQ
ncbi:MAG: 16S/23S rRNA (cytidine-2'-O)-methyltransferase, partial [Propionibacteriales bacterium]|nr:16S/23S rRNA (cytidine-2'-O)-methyltransferase [Propionibacteriales bacterium]